MKLAIIIEALRARRHLLRWAGLAVIVLLPVLDALPFVVDKAKAHTAVEKLPGFWAVYGLAGCLILVIGSKLLGKAGLQRKEGVGDE